MIGSGIKKVARIKLVEKKTNYYIGSWKRAKEQERLSSYTPKQLLRNLTVTADQKSKFYSPKRNQAYELERIKRKIKDATHPEKREAYKNMYWITRMKMKFNDKEVFTPRPQTENTVMSVKQYMSYYHKEEIRAEVETWNKNHLTPFQSWRDEYKEAYDAQLEVRYHELQELGVLKPLAQGSVYGWYDELNKVVISEI